MTPTIILSDSTVIDCFQLRMTVFEILHASKDLQSVSFNQLRRDCEDRLELTEKCLDGSAIKELLTNFFSDFLDIREVHNNRRVKISRELPMYQSSVVESDFVSKVFTEYVVNNKLSIRDIEFRSSRRARHAVWEILLTLVPHIPIDELQAMVMDSFKKNDHDQKTLPGNRSKTSKHLNAKNSLASSPNNAAVDTNKNRNSKSVQSPVNAVLAVNIVQSPTACIAMKSTFSTLKWINCIQQRGAKRESQLTWADIDKDLHLPYSYSAKRWSVIVKSVPEHLSFPKKLDKLYEMYSVSGKEKIASSSVALSTRKRSCNVSDDDKNSISDDSIDCSPETLKTQHAKKREKVDGSKGTKKTPLGNILSSLLRKKEGFPVDESSEADYTQESQIGGSPSAPCQTSPRSGGADLSGSSGDHRRHVDCQVTGSDSTESVKDRAALSGTLIESMCLANATGNGSILDSTSIENRDKLDLIEKKKRKLVRIQKRLRKIIRAQVRERKGFKGDCSANGGSSVCDK